MWLSVHNLETLMSSLQFCILHLHVTLKCKDMKSLRDLVAHWQSLTTWDFIILFWISSIIFGVLLVTYLFKSFIDSKPTGRKTVLGNLMRHTKILS